MVSESTNFGVSFVVDRRGRKTHALLPIKEYERLTEDDYDNQIADLREKDGSISSEEFKKHVRNRRVSH